MAESNEQTPPQSPAAPANPPAAPVSRAADRVRRDADAEIDAELAKATGRTVGDPRAGEVSLKRQWDADLEAELEAALSGFDPKSFDSADQRRPRSDRVPDPAQLRGQEGSPGKRTGKVIGVRGRSLFVDLGGKSEGVLPIEQFEGAEIPAPGAAIEVMVDRFDPEEGVQILRLKGAAVEATWENVRRGVVVEARVTKVVKGGVEVDVDGIRGFLPISQIDLARVEDAATYVNQRFKAIVTEANQREKNLVVSRRELLEQERAEQREKTWKTLEEGQIREGTVRSVKDFGAFVDLGGVDGLLPIGEMSWSRVGKVDDLVRIGDKVTVKLLKIDRTAQKLTLGLKQLMPSPWEGAGAKYLRGTMVKGKVTRIMDFGAFVELEPGVEGLIHISELSPTRVRRVADIVKPDQEVEVRILKVDPEEKKIALSLLPDPRKAGIEPEGAEEPEDDTPPVPKPERKVPLKGGLGDRDRRN
ncbi:MAG: 30S ribosomal protein S1 [Isosphaeraceae bacterium]